MEEFIRDKYEKLSIYYTFILSEDTDDRFIENLEQDGFPILQLNDFQSFEQHKFNYRLFILNYFNFRQIYKKHKNEFNNVLVCYKHENL